MLALFVFFRLLLAGVFALAALAKLRHPARTREDLAGLGLPPRLVPAAGIALPLAELGVAALLLIGPLAGMGAWLALGLLVVFTAVIAANLLRGRRPACACFGSLSRATIGAGAVARNLSLMAVAGALLLPPSVLPPDLDKLAPVVAPILLPVLAGGVLVLLAGLLFQLWRQQGRLLLRIEQLEQRAQAATSAPAEPTPTRLPRPVELAGQPAPALAWRDAAGQRIHLPSLRGEPALLLFFDSTCQHCRPLLSRLREWRPAAHTIVILAGPPRDLEVAPGIHVVAEDALSTMQAFGVLGTPTGIEIDADGIVSGPAARGNAAVARLLDRYTQPEEQHELATA